MSVLASRSRLIAIVAVAAIFALFLRYCVVFVPGGGGSSLSRLASLDQPATAAGGLAIPVVGVGKADLVDTFTQAREEGARRHDAIDILAPRGTPVVAAADGRIEKLFESERGGTTLYERSTDGRWVYYYAHLDRYAPGVADGQAIRRGQTIAFVGSTGDASPDAPHLHFEAHRMLPGQRWHEGEAINPYPMLVGR